MKKFLTPLLLFVLACSFYSCAGKDGPNYSDVFPSIIATNNGIAWAPTLTDTLKNDTLTLHARLKPELLRLEFPVSGANYTLAERNAQYYTYDNTGTNITKTFKLDPSYPNAVTGIVNNTTNALNKYVTGRFNVRFILDTSVKTNDTTGTNTVTIVNGSFTAVYK
jgi:hypothetical protein